MNVAVVEKKQLSPRKLNIKQDLFCKYYATGDIMGSGYAVYRKVYGEHISYDVAKASATRFLNDERITARIDEYLEVDGFNNQTVDKHHLFLIKQKKDLNVSGKMIVEYNKLKKRTDNSLTLIVPKPIMNWDDETDTIRKIDKSKAKDV